MPCKKISLSSHKREREREIQVKYSYSKSVTLGTGIDWKAAPCLNLTLFKRSPNPAASCRLNASASVEQTHHEYCVMLGIQAEEMRCFNSKMHQILMQHCLAQTKACNRHCHKSSKGKLGEHCPNICKPQPLTHLEFHLFSGNCQCSAVWQVLSWIKKGIERSEGKMNTL